MAHLYVLVFFLFAAFPDPVTFPAVGECFSLPSGFNHRPEEDDHLTSNVHFAWTLGHTQTMFLVQLRCPTFSCTGFVFFSLQSVMLATPCTLGAATRPAVGTLYPGFRPRTSVLQRVEIWWRLTMVARLLSSWSLGKGNTRTRVFTTHCWLYTFHRNEEAISLYK